MMSQLFRRAALGTLACLLVVAAPTTSAQAPTGRETTAASVASYPLADDMPVDPEVLVGSLPNGLRFYVRPNGKPAKQAELRLVVKAGSVLEDDNQRGLAHFVEHMQFEGSRHFPDGGINDFLASLGLSFGADANAATSFDDTQYTLRVPTDRPGALDAAFTVLEDWAGGATFDPAGIERQRPIVLAEWRRDLGAGERTGEALRKVQLAGSRYADRRPIGTPDVIQTAPREQLLRFYRDWYRPNLMAVIVVGDVDRQAVAGMIAKHFSGLTNPSPERPRPIFDVPEHPETKYALVTDKETTATVVQLSNLRPARNQGSVGGYRDIMKDQLFAQMLGDRLDEVSQGANPPFLRAGAGRGLFPAPRTRDNATVQALVTNDGVARGLDALVTELERVARFGFTASELDRAKQANMAGYERAAGQSQDRQSESRADEYTRNFLQREALPTIWQELAFHRRFLPEITLKEMNALAGDWFPTQNRLVVVSAPEIAGARLPSDSELAAVMATASAKSLTRYEEAGGGAMLMDARPSPGAIVKTTARPDGITEWVLSNGATVVIQPTTLKVDQILFRAIAPGGTSLASDADFLSARVADDVIPAGGVGKFSAVALDRLTSGKAVGVWPFISEVSQGMRGGGAPPDLETMFQLIYLRFTQPRADPTAFAAVKAQALGALANRNASPDVVFAETLEATFNQNHPRRLPETAETVARWNLDTALAFYKSRFANASNYTFIFVGSFTPDAIKPLVETYVASLPSTRAPETWRDVGVALPRGVVSKTVTKGIAPKSEVSIVFSGPFEDNDGNRLALRTAVILLQSRLNDVIREQLGGTYSITAQSAMGRIPKPEYRVQIDWTCDPARVEVLTQRVLDEVGFVKGTLLSRDQVARVRDLLQRDLERNSQDNAYLLNQLARRIEDGGPASLASANTEAADIAALTGSAIQRAAIKYFDTANYVKVTLMPEGK